MSSEGYYILRLLACYLKLASWIGLDVHTECTLKVIQTELLHFDAALQAYMQVIKASNYQ
ncbi:hypothetical protein HD554DRAFT_2176893 [Boletus coccyginus]|nr:hypothetical protein HD554DRAFT_2176893 [Boletus coccyginus]